jgi:hypothetical protein
MKKFILTSSLFILIPLFIYGQSSDPLLSKCSLNAGPNTTYLKDFRIQLGKGISQPEFRQKQIFPLSKNMKYRFTLCNSDNSTGQLIMKIKDSEGKIQVSSYDPKSGKIYPSVDFTCNKTGTYQIFFDFRDFQQGLGVGIVSLVSEKK